MLLRRTTKNILFALLIGALFGTFLGELISLIVPEGPAKRVIFYNLKFGINNFSLNLLFFNFSFSFQLVINLFTVLFVFLMIYILVKH